MNVENVYIVRAKLFERGGDRQMERLHIVPDKTALLWNATAPFVVGGVLSMQHQWVGTSSYFPGEYEDVPSWR